MSTSSTAHNSPFRLPHNPQSQSPLFSLPFELRRQIYAQLYQPRAYHYEVGRGIVDLHHEECQLVTLKDCLRDQACTRSFLETGLRRAPYGKRPWFHRICGCSGYGTVGLLRVCQRAYVETQATFLRSATVILWQNPPLPNAFNLRQQPHRPAAWADQLRLFNRMFLRSSLSELSPLNCLRQLCLKLPDIRAYETYNTVKAINDCRLRLQSLSIELDMASLPNYNRSQLLDSHFFKAMLLLQDVKDVQITWGYIERNLVHALDEPEIWAQCFRQPFPKPADPREFFSYLESVQQRYRNILNRAFTEIASRPRVHRKRLSTLHNEARATFMLRAPELMKEEGLCLRN